MTKLVSIGESNKADKKMMAVFDNDGRKKTVHFGAKGMDDYTITKDKEQRSNYRTRHAKDLDTNDPTRAGFLSYYILWNKPTVQASITDYKKRFGF
jgi:hypothetical protein